MSVKHTDGRRLSGVGRNLSKLHIANPQDGLHAMCGKEIQLQVTGKFIRQEQVGFCSICRRRWERLFGKIDP
jgi:hypothetical protein